MRTLLTITALSSLISTIPACATDATEAEDGENDSVSGKADWDGVEDGTPEARGMLRVVNEMSDEVWREGCGLSARTAASITNHRDGADNAMGTADDDLVETLVELDRIPYVGPVAFEKILECAYTLDLVSDAPAVLLHYSAGNQISGSDLTIRADGTGELKERFTPTDIRTSAITPLSNSELATLRAAIQAAALGDVDESDGEATSYGSGTAELIALHGAEPVVITQVQRDTDGDGHDEVAQNTAPEAEQIRALVDALVEHDVPR